MRAVLAITVLGACLTLLATLSPAEELPPINPVVCGDLGPNVDCVAAAAANCVCHASLYCENAERDPYSRPITYTANENGAKLERKTGPCYQRRECLNSGGQDGGLCNGIGGTLDYCIMNDQTVNEGTQRYYEVVGSCGPL
jgi:hypothetical protein